MKPLKNQVITFRMEEDNYIQLQKIAEEKDRTIAYLVNKICEEYLKENNNKCDLVLSYRLGKKKQTIAYTQYPTEKLMKIRLLEEKCKESECNIIDLLDFLLEILTIEDIERIPVEFNSGYLHKKYNIENNDE